jgi:hypothetical protein
MERGGGQTIGLDPKGGGGHTVGFTSNTYPSEQSRRGSRIAGSDPRGWATPRDQIPGEGHSRGVSFKFEYLVEFVFIFAMTSGYRYGG